MNTRPFCAYPFERFRVTCEGDVFMCCFQRERPIGNLLESTLEEIWFGKLAREIRKETLEGRLHPRCKVSDCAHVHRSELPTANGVAYAYPNTLEVDLPNTHCNIGGFKPSEKNPGCLMCDRSRPYFKFHKEDHLPEILPKLKPLLPHLEKLHIQGVSEAFWHDYLFRVLDLLDFDGHSSHIVVSTYTNGIPLKAERRKRFFERCPNSHVTFSLDAATPETYRKLRRLDAYDRVVENLMAYAEERKQYPGAKLAIHNNVNLINIHEVEGMVRTAVEAKVDFFDFDPTTGYCTDITVNEKNYPLFQEAARRIEAEAARLGARVSFTRPMDLGYGSGTNYAQRTGPAMQGFLDNVTDEYLFGWVWDPGLGDEPATLEVCRGDEPVFEIKADLFREDLVRDGYGKGHHAFIHPVPPVMFQFPGETFRIRVKGSDFELVNSPFRFRPTSATVNPNQ